MEAWLFPGQGAQRPGMGSDLLDRFPGYRSIADRLLGYSIADVCLGAIPGGLRKTEYVQPALFVVNALSYLARAENGMRPAFLAGHSLGEFDALWAAGCFDFETGLRLVRRRAELMGRADGGSMAAVVGLDIGTVTSVVAQSGVGGVDMANHNAPDQVVLSGPTAEIDSVASLVRSAGGRFVPLNVSAAFHSRHMRGAAEAFADEVADVRFAPPDIPVISNVTASPYPADGIGDLLVRQMTARCGGATACAPSPPAGCAGSWRSAPVRY
jgi:trans-AT polyketide synthase/acyltransferase/oxidoreductase domain-containing protein